MYCKFCGEKVDTDTVKCARCGANIDLNDGGQSFFDDKELNDWQSDMWYGNQTSVPKTKMIEPSKSNDDEFNQYNNLMVQGTNSKNANSHKTSKNISLKLNLSSSNKLIIFCITSALAIVLLVVAIIAVLNSDNGAENDNQSSTDTVGYSQQSRDTEEILNNMAEIKNIKIYDKDGNEISHSVPGYIDKDYVLYVSVDKILKHEGYKNGKKKDGNKNHILYEHKSNGKTIEIEKGTNKIWITEPDKDTVMLWLDSVNFNVGDNTYIPIKSFLVKNGYEEDKIKWNEQEKTLYFNE